jgi:hypothetical protein
MHQCSLMSLSTAASTATVAKRATVNDNDPDDGDRNNVGIPYNTVILNVMMEDSQSDIGKQLKYWGKKEEEGNAVLDKYAFYALLDNIGYGRCWDGLFDGLLAGVRCAPASSTLSLSSLRVDILSLSGGSRGGGNRVVMLHNIRNLFLSELYHLLLILTINNGEALMVDVMHLLDDCWGVDMNNGLETCRLGKNLLDIFDGRCLTDNELRNVVKKLDANGKGNGKINIKEFASIILKTNDNDLSEMNSEFNKVLFSPSLTTNKEFIVSLEEYTRDHHAVTLESQQEFMF